MITQQQKTLENPNIVCIKAVTLEHLKASRKLSKTKRQAEKVSQVGFGKSSNNKTKEKFLNEKMQE